MQLIDNEEKTYLCEKFYETAKTALLETGMHNTIFFLVNEDQVLMVPNIMRLDKPEYCGLISHLAKEMNSRAVICIAEMWGSVLEEGDKRAEDPHFAPSQDPDAKEGLVVVVSDAFGDATAKMGFFTKKDDTIEFQEEECLDGATLNMIPPWVERTIH